MRFPQTFIDDLRRQADIVRLIQDYVALKKKGANWMACCPFHQEKTPSFSVNPAKDIFYCFGCGKGGSVFTFVMEIERVTFPEAVRIVAEKAHVPLPVMEEDKRFESRRRDADEIIELNSWALEWWEAQLEQAGAEARAARDYLAGRGITDETRRVFRLGYAPDRWDALSAHLKERGATGTQIERSGLVVRKDTGGFYDRFRGRVIFPVLDAQGRAVAFGGRTLSADGEPKYLNSPETAAYTKGRHLYGLHQTRDEIRRKGFVILVEGYLDLIIPYQFGVRNIVASLGTALTREQFELLGRFARKVVVNYDGDRAGKKAAKRAVDVQLQTLLASGFNVKVLTLPAGADPDEFVRTHGVEEYNRQRGAAPSWIQFVIDQAVEQRNLQRPKDKAEAFEEVLPYVRAVPNGIERREYFDIAMNALRIEEATLRRELWQMVKAGSNADSSAIKQHITRAAGAKPTVAEQKLLELLIHDEDLRRIILPQLEAEMYEVLPTALIFRTLIELEHEGGEINFDRLNAALEGDEELTKFAALLWWSEPQRDNDEAMDDVQAIAESCLMALRLMAVDRQISELGTEIAEAENAGDTERSNRLVMERLELSRRRSALLPRAEAAHGQLGL
ncbi:MAG TPA: DNA primase [Pyrinomonadaceae bacterium]|jgi:DNA primase